jgi:hypothetical protein
MFVQIFGGETSLEDIEIDRRIEYSVDQSERNLFLRAWSGLK